MLEREGAAGEGRTGPGWLRFQTYRCLQKIPILSRNRFIPLVVRVLVCMTLYSLECENGPAAPQGVVDAARRLAEQDPAGVLGGRAPVAEMAVEGWKLNPLWEKLPLLEKLKALALREHSHNEMDTFYTCPRHLEAWADHKDRPCDCGADSHNREVEALWVEILG